MKNKKDLPAQAGFTLIELLVVIAIIGVLSSIVLVSLNVARAKGADAKVKAQVTSTRDAAEVFFNANASYDGIAGPVSWNCSTADSMFQDANSGMAQYTDVNNYPMGTTLRCSSTAGTFVITASLHNAGEFWCVDSTGTSKFVTAADHVTAHPDDATECLP